MPRNPSIKSPWAARDRVAEREAKREAVLQTAARAFAENGYHRTSLEEIAARLGVSKPTIYYYAQNKDDLVAAIAARALDEIVAAMDADEQSSALSQLSHLLRRYAEIMTTDFGQCAIVVRDARIKGAVGEGLRKSMSLIDARIRELLILGEKDGSIAKCDVKLTSFMIAGAINEIVRWYDPAGTLAPPMLAEKFVNQLTTGLAPRK